MKLTARQQTAATAIRRTTAVRGMHAFTLLELLAVMAIIAIIAGLAAPMLKRLGSADGLTSGGRQLLDDFGLARSLALSTRSTVYVVFVPTNLNSIINFSLYTNYSDRVQLTNLMGKTYNGYALYSEHSVGDQPGTLTPRYLTPWKELPQGVFIMPDEYDTNSVDGSFNYISIPFPNTNNLSLTAYVPYIAFNPSGQLIGGSNLFLSVAEGSIERPRNTDDNSLTVGASAVHENPAGNHTNQTLYVNWLTGRGKFIRPEIQ